MMMTQDGGSRDVFEGFKTSYLPHDALCRWFRMITKGKGGKGCGGDGDDNEE